jgi:heme-degrading monooxygenase HmoA
MTIEKGSIAVIFVSRRTGADAEGYARAAAEMEQAVASAPGYLGHDSVSSADGGITISYWRDEASVAAWRAHARHSAVRQAGRDHWYDFYRLVVASVMRSDEWHP